MHSYLMEATGTFFLVLVYGFTGEPLAIGLTLMALIYIGVRVSGGHYNPAVSLAFFLKKKITSAELLGYVSSQLLGGFLAAFVVYLLSGAVFYVTAPSTTNLVQQAIAEVLFTFIFVLIMLVFSLSKHFRKYQMIGLVGGLTFTGVLMVSAPISGGILNPAIAIGTAGFDFIQGGNSYLSLWGYVLAPLCGGALAALAFNYFQPVSEG